jgi:uncharacterized protein YehS (DUF1456 family)
MGSLSNVVGYQSVKSTVSDSPLFTTRTQRAINQQQNIITSQYLGMGKHDLVQFSMRDNKTETLKKIINYINKMDDKVFADLTKLVIQKAKQENIIRDTDLVEIVKTISLLRTNPEIIDFFTYTNDQSFYSSWLCHTSSNWIPGCIIFWIFMPIIVIIGLLLIRIIDILTSIEPLK